MVYEIHLYFFKAGHSEVFGSFSAELLDHMIPACRAIWLDPSIGCEDVMIMDTQTGEIVWDAEVEDDAYDEPADIDDDCGFDPYLGCFTDNC